MSELDRKEIDKVRRLLVDAFMSEDVDTYAKCVTELETLIGVPHGDRNPKANGSRVVNSAEKAAHMRAAKKFAWGNRSLEAEIFDDGYLIYSIKYGEGEE